LDYLTTHTSLSPIRRGFTPGFVNYKKRYTRLAAASDKVYQLLVHGRWLSPGTPASSTTNTGCHDIAEILLKVALSTKNQIKSTYSSFLASSQFTTSIHCPCYCTVHVYVVIHIDANLCRFVLSFVCMYCRWRISYQKRRVGVPLTGFTLPHFCACPNPGTWFSIVICRGLLVFSEFSSNDSECLFCWYWWNC